MTFNDLAPIVRLNNYIKKLGAGLEQIETLIANITISKEPQKLIDTANQIAQITIIPLDKIPDHIKRQQDDDEEIERAGAILEQKNIDIQIIEEFKKLGGTSEVWSLHGISTYPCIRSTND